MEIEQAEMKEQIVDMEEGVLETRLFPVSYASVDDMKGFLTEIKSDRGSIIADSRNKQLIIRDVAAVLLDGADRDPLALRGVRHLALADPKAVLRRRELCFPFL